jgi:hypothetical protein
MPTNFSIRTLAKPGEAAAASRENDPVARLQRRPSFRAHPAPATMLTYSDACRAGIHDAGPVEIYAVWYRAAA